MVLSPDLVKEFHKAIYMKKAERVTEIIEQHKQRGKDVLNKLLEAYVAPGVLTYDKGCRFYKGQNALHLAVLGENQEIFDIILKNCKNPDARNYRSDTAMCLISRYGIRQIHFIDALLHAGSDLNCKVTPDGENALNLAIRASIVRTEIIEALVAKGAAISTEREKYSPIYSTLHGEAYIIELLAKSPHVEPGSPALVAAFHCAAYTGEFEHLRMMFEKGLVTKDSVDSEGNNALHFACSWIPKKSVQEGDHDLDPAGKERCVYFLAEAGMDVNAVNICGEAPIHWAVGLGGEHHVSNCPWGIHALLDSGANVNALNLYGQTPLLLSLMLLEEDTAREIEEDPEFFHYSVDEAVSTLIEHGASCNMPSFGGITPISFAIREGLWNFVDYMSDDIDIGFKDSNNESLLHHACRSLSTSQVHLEFVQRLVEDGRYLNLATKDTGETPLMLAVQFFSNEKEVGKEELSLVRILLSSGKIDADKRNVRGGSCLHYLAHRYWTWWHELLVDLLKDLVSAGANINGQDNDGNTVLHLRAATDNPYLLDFIKALMGVGVDINLKNNQGQSVLHSALQYVGDFRREEVAFLLESGIQLNFEAIIDAASLNHDRAINDRLDRDNLEVIFCLTKRYIGLVGSLATESQTTKRFRDCPHNKESAKRHKAAV